MWCFFYPNGFILPTQQSRSIFSRKWPRLFTVYVRDEEMGEIWLLFYAWNHERAWGEIFRGLSTSDPLTSILYLSSAIFLHQTWKWMQTMRVEKSEALKESFVNNNRGEKFWGVMTVQALTHKPLLYSLRHESERKESCI